MASARSCAVTGGERQRPDMGEVGELVEVVRHSRLAKQGESLCQGRLVFDRDAGAPQPDGRAVSEDLRLDVGAKGNAARLFGQAGAFLRVQAQAERWGRFTSLIFLMFYGNVRRYY